MGGPSDKAVWVGEMPCREEAKDTGFPGETDPDQYHFHSPLHHFYGNFLNNPETVSDTLHRLSLW